ncbi:MAG: AbrB/MazE/SpoVT family DNA-binding domain-containing protein [Spirochaetaceae bacterium]|nr:AbrB/MazE/SpoVT family DNA-binding domain-containing protein [Spirochaetaceae bacterium]
MRISERGQITIPKHLRDRFGLSPDVEIEITPTDRGLLIHKRITAEHPVDRVYAVLGKTGSTDNYIEEIRGR